MKNLKRPCGFFIALEGIDGSGKSTAAKFLQKFLQDRKHSTLLTREPGGTALGEDLRKLVLQPEANLSICPDAELLIMYAARMQLIHELIQPSLAEDKVVISDRFYASSIAYQGYGQGIDLTILSRLQELFIGEFKPDLTLLFDLNVDDGLQRVMHRGQGTGRFEQKQIEFLERVRTGYLKIANDPHVRVIEAQLPLEQVQAQLSKIIMEFL
ncbi:MAG: dTMP kinase [Candidatus Eutrophobiaceae bacterium]